MIASVAPALRSFFSTLISRSKATSRGARIAAAALKWRLDGLISSTTSRSVRAACGCWVIKGELIKHTNATVTPPATMTFLAITIPPGNPRGTGRGNPCPIHLLLLETFILHRQAKPVYYARRFPGGHPCGFCVPRIPSGPGPLTAARMQSLPRINGLGRGKDESPRALGG